MKRIYKTLCGCGAASVLSAGLNAGVQAAAGAAGASMLGMHYDGYDVIEAAQMGVIGGTVMSVPSSVRHAYNRFFYNDREAQSFSSNVINIFGSSAVSGLIGYGVLQTMSVETAMDIGETAAAFAVGGELIMMPAAYVLICVIIPLATVGVSFLKSEEKPETENKNNHDDELELGVIGHGNSMVEKAEPGDFCNYFF